MKKLSFCSSSKLFPYFVYLVLSIIFAREFLVLFMRWWDGKVAISVKEMKSEYVKFPSIGVCLDKDTTKEEIGFKRMRRLNETFTFIDFVQHFDNG